MIFSGHALINSWRIPSPPWKQTDIEKNLAGQVMDTADYYTAECRKLLELRMSLLPYLYSAFVEYEKTGKPPIRAIVMDYPEDETAAMVDDEYFFGESMLVCPLTYEEGTKRNVYLPKGSWYDFFTKEKLEGGCTIEVYAEYNRIPVYVKDGSMIPLAEPVQYVDKDTVFEMRIECFGEPDGVFCLYEDDFETYDYQKQQNCVVIEKRPGCERKITRNGNLPVRYKF